MKLSIVHDYFEQPWDALKIWAYKDRTLSELLEQLIIKHKFSKTEFNYELTKSILTYLNDSIVKRNCELDIGKEIFCKKIYSLNLND